MRNGDISNTVSSLNVGVRLNGYLADPGRMSAFQKVRCALGGRMSTGAVDPAVLRLVERLYYRSAHTVDLVYVGTSEWDANRYAGAVGGVPYNRLLLAEDLYGVESLLRSGSLSCYVGPPRDVERMCGEHAYTREEFKQAFRKVF